MICTIQLRRLLLLMAAATSLALPILLNSARSAEPDTVTIEANKERELKRQIGKFVADAVFTYLNDSLERWNTPICPLVAGLPKERGEFILAPGVRDRQGCACAARARALQAQPVHRGIGQSGRSPAEMIQA
jgi:hypothetical protein